MLKGGQLRAVSKRADDLDGEFAALVQMDKHGDVFFGCGGDMSKQVAVRIL